MISSRRAECKVDSNHNRENATRAYRIVSLHAPLAVLASFLYLAIVLPGCGRKKESPEAPAPGPFQDAGPYAGSYRIDPGAFDEVLTIAPAGRVVYRSRKSDIPQEGTFQRDQKTLRIFMQGEESSGPTGIFLLSSYNPSEWKGIWRGNVRFLKRIHSSDGETNHAP